MNESAVLWETALGDVEPGHQLDAADDGITEPRGIRRPKFLEASVDPEPDRKPVRRRFKVQV